MVASFFIMFAAIVWFWWLRWRHREVLLDKWPLRLILLASPFGMIALESGWLVTEFGRQPWIARGHMRVIEAVTPQTSIGLVLLTFIAVYLGLTAGLLKLLMLPVVTGKEAEPPKGERHVDS